MPFLNYAIINNTSHISVKEEAIHHSRWKASNMKKSWNADAFLMMIEAELKVNRIAEYSAVIGQSVFYLEDMILFDASVIMMMEIGLGWTI